MNLKKYIHKINLPKKKYRLVPVEKNEKISKEDFFLWLALFGVMFFGFILILNVFLLIFSKHIIPSPNTFKTIIAIIVSGTLCVISYIIMDYFRKHDFVDPTFERIREQKRIWFIANGVQVDAKIVLILKRVQFKNDFSEDSSVKYKITTYIFDVEYYDKEEHRYRTISSEYYSNDIRNVFADNKVKIYFNPNNKKDYFIDEIKLRQSDSEPICKIPIRDWTEEI